MKYLLLLLLFISEITYAKCVKNIFKSSLGASSNVFEYQHNERALQSTLATQAGLTFDQAWIIYCPQNSMEYTSNLHLNHIRFEFDEVNKKANETLATATFRALKIVSEHFSFGLQAGLEQDMRVYLKDQLEGDNEIILKQTISPVLRFDIGSRKGNPLYAELILDFTFMDKKFHKSTDPNIILGYLRKDTKRTQDFQIGLAKDSIHDDLEQTTHYKVFFKWGILYRTGGVQ